VEQSAPAAGIVLIIDDDVFNRSGINTYLTRHGYTVMEAGDEETALLLAGEHKPHAAIVDIVIPSTPYAPTNSNRSVGIQLARHLKRLDPGMGIVIFSAYVDRGAEVREMVREGARGIAYLKKGVRPERILRALKDTISGRLVLDGITAGTKAKFAQEFLDQLTPEERPWIEKAILLVPTLTDREWEIALRRASSQNIAGIAISLGITSKTVENHITHIYEKLGLDHVDRRAPTLQKSSLLAKACMLYDLTKSSD